LQVSPVHSFEDVHLAMTAVEQFVEEGFADSCVYVLSKTRNALL